MTFSLPPSWGIWLIFIRNSELLQQWFTDCSGNHLHACAPPRRMYRTFCGTHLLWKSCPVDWYKALPPYPSADCIAFTTCLRNTRSRIERVVQNLIHINKFIENRQAFWLPCFSCFPGQTSVACVWRTEAGLRYCYQVRERVRWSGDWEFPVG